jgi:hypothetical protein
MMMKRTCRGCLAFAVWIGLAVSAAAQSNDYNSAVMAWEAGDFKRVIDLLSLVRGQPEGRRVEVDYMLGVSACKTDGNRQWGRNLLNAISYKYSVATGSLRTIENERDNCQLPIPTNKSAPSPAQITPQRAAGMAARAKSFFVAGGNRPVLAYPVRPVRPIAPSELQSRRVIRGNTEQATSLAHRLMPQATHIVRDSIIITTTARQRPQELEIIAETLASYIRFLEINYSLALPPYYIHVYLIPDTVEVHDLANGLHGLDVSPATLGYAFPDDGSVVGVVQGTFDGTILHELFHLIVRTGFGDIPQWLDEGIASVYEESARRGDRFFGLPNWRRQVLAQFAKQQPTIRQLLRSNWFLFDDPKQIEVIERDLKNSSLNSEYAYTPEAQRQAAMLATARYFVLYLEQHNQLVSIFNQIRNDDFTSVRGDIRDRVVRVVESALGRDVDTINQEFIAWLNSNSAPLPNNQ